MNPSFKPLVQTALEYLSIRDRSRGEIAQHLLKKTPDSELIEQVIAYLVDHKLIDDQQFGISWAASRARRSHGDLKIRYELKLKGLSPEAVNQAIVSVSDTDWQESIQNFLDKKQLKLKSLPNPYQKKAKIYQLLSQRGYSPKLIDAFLRGKVE